MMMMTYEVYFMSREKAPGQRECAAALETLNKQLRALDQAAIQAVGQELIPRKSNTLQGKNNILYITLNIFRVLL